MRCWSVCRLLNIVFSASDQSAKTVTTQGLEPSASSLRFDNVTIEFLGGSQTNGSTLLSTWVKYSIPTPTLHKLQSVPQTRFDDRNHYRRWRRWVSSRLCAWATWQPSLGAKNFRSAASAPAPLPSATPKTRLFWQPPFYVRTVTSMYSGMRKCL